MSRPAKPRLREELSSYRLPRTLSGKVSVVALVGLEGNYALDAVLDIFGAIRDPGDCTRPYRCIIRILMSITLALIVRFICEDSNPSASPPLRNEQKRQFCRPEAKPKGWRAEMNAGDAEDVAGEVERESHANVSGVHVTNVASNDEQVSAALNWLEFGHVKESQDAGQIDSQARRVLESWIQRAGPDQRNLWTYYLPYYLPQHTLEVPRDLKDFKRDGPDSRNPWTGYLPQHKREVPRDTKCTRVCDASNLQSAPAARREPQYAEVGPYKGKLIESHAERRLNLQAESVPDPWAAGGDPWSTPVRNRCAHAKTKAAFDSEQAESVPDSWSAGGDTWSTPVRKRCAQAKTKAVFSPEPTESVPDPWVAGDDPWSAPVRNRCAHARTKATSDSEQIESATDPCVAGDDSLSTSVRNRQTQAKTKAAFYAEQTETAPDPWVAEDDPWSTSVPNPRTQAKTKAALCSEYKPRSDDLYSQRTHRGNLYPAPWQPWLAWVPCTWDSTQRTLFCLLCKKQVSDVDDDLSDDYSGLHGALSMVNQVGHRKKMENLMYWMDDSDYWGHIVQERQKYHPVYDDDRGSFRKRRWW